MERATKVAVVLAALGMLAFDLVIGRAWASMAVAGLAIFLTAALLTALDRRLVAVVLATAFVFPAFVKLTLDTYSVQFSVLWMAALTGAIASDALSSRWHLPPRWRAPLVLAALAVAVATPIVIARELDFNVALFEPMPDAVLSGLPPFFAEWVSHVGLTLLLGVLWFDWLIGARDLDLERWVVAPLGASAGVMAAVSVYQLFGDITFLNETAYAAGQRATGTLYDANVAGTIAAASLGGALVWSERARGWPRLAASGAMLLFALAVWASGSRTAFGAALVVLTVRGVAGWRGHGEQRRGVDPRWVLGAVGLLTVFVLVVSATSETAIGPLRRLANLGQESRSGTFSGLVVELWNRNGYGAAATNLIGRFPWAGIGIGGFHIFGPPLSPVGTLPPDNAQNWLRHQLVEMGVLGAAGWFAFSASFAWFVLTPRRALPSWAASVRGIVIAFGLISLLGMPTQEISATVVFVTAAAWFVRLTTAEVEAHPLSWRTWVVVGLLTAAFGLATAQTARTTLRVPNRARAIGWPYSYGFYGPEPDTEGGLIRWTTRRAAALVDVEGRTLRLSVKVPHVDIGRHPVDVEVWCEGRSVIRAHLTSNDPVSTELPVPAGLKQTLIDVTVSRAVRPSDFGDTDARELAALTKWEFLP